MNKFLSIVVLGLLWCNMGFADVIELSKCHKDKYATWDNFYSKQKLDVIDDHTITINPSNSTVTKTLYRSKANVKRVNDELKKLGSKGTFKKVTQLIFEITTYTNTVVTGRLIENIDPLTLKDAAWDKTIYVNLETGGYDLLTRTFNSKTMKQILPDMESTFICDGFESASTEQSSSSSGTAFFINNRGNLLTNNHVVDGCKSLSINYNNKEYDAQLIATDKTLDLALLKANVRSKSFINFSNYNPKKLQKIYVAGYPFGKGLSDDLKISSGIISSLKGVQDNSNELQIDAAINHGNSGGPIVGEGGELIAIAVSGLGKEMSEGINFGIKSSAALNFLGANDIDPSRSNRIKLNSDKLLKILEESTIYISCTY